MPPNLKTSAAESKRVPDRGEGVSVADHRDFLFHIQRAFNRTLHGRKVKLQRPTTNDVVLEVIVAMCGPNAQ